MTARLISLFAFLALVAAVAAFGSTFETGPWYRVLAKPDWTPPGWLFGPVWTILYVLIAIAGWLVWRAGGAGPAMTAWVVQLVFNGMWPWIFFGLHQVGLALASIIVLWFAIGAFTVLAWPTSRTASLIFIPYWAWVTYAAILNLEIWRLNQA